MAFRVTALHPVFLKNVVHAVENVQINLAFCSLIRTFAPDMYTLNEYLPIFVGDDLPEKGWDNGMYCLKTDAVKVLRSNLQRGFVSSFAFVVVDKGWMTIHYNGLLTPEWHEPEGIPEGEKLSISEQQRTYK